LDIFDIISTSAEFEIDLLVSSFYLLTFFATVILYILMLSSVYYSNIPENKFKAIKYFVLLVAVRLIIYLTGGDHQYLFMLEKITITSQTGIQLLFFINILVFLIITCKLLKIFIRIFNNIPRDGYLSKSVK